MKKVLSLIMVLVLGISLSACGGSNEAVMEAVAKDTWFGHMDTDYGYIEIEFNFSYAGDASSTYTYGTDGIFVDDLYNPTYIPGPSRYLSREGSYTIKNGKIIVSYEDGTDDFIKYTYSNGDLTLVLDYDGQEIILDNTPRY